MQLLNHDCIAFDNITGLRIGGATLLEDTTYSVKPGITSVLASLGLGSTLTANSALMRFKINHSKLTIFLHGAGNIAGSPTDTALYAKVTLNGKAFANKTTPSAIANDFRANKAGFGVYLNDYATEAVGNVQLKNLKISNAVGAVTSGGNLRTLINNKIKPGTSHIYTSPTPLGGVIQGLLGVTSEPNRSTALGSYSNAFVENSWYNPPAMPTF